MAAAEPSEVGTFATTALTDVGGAELLEGLRAALAYLQANQDVVNDLNVFPVPDGDTGSNMYLTLRSAVEDASQVGEPTNVGAVLGAAAHGSLMGARGNSGVILSQILRGLAAGAAERARLDAAGAAAALVSAREVAYKAVMKPTEGTVLTVIREASEAADEAAREATADVLRVLDAAVLRAHASVERTPEMLAVLRDAGVVDAGGFGLAVILEGLARSLHGVSGAPALDARAPGAIEPVVRRPGEEYAENAEENADENADESADESAEDSAANGAKRASARPAGAPSPRGAAAVAAKEGGWGYCTEFLINGPGLDAEALRDELGGLGDSSLVVGDPELVRVHIHTHEPGALIAVAAQRGRLTKLKVEDMSQQHHDVLERAASDGSAAAAAEVPPPPAAANGASAERKAIGVVTVAPSGGFREILAGIGADSIVEGGQTMNPSTEELLDAVRAANADSVIILPNNKNVILSAQQVDDLVDGVAVRVVPSRSLPQGIAALLALDPAAPLDENCARMTESLERVTTVEVTRAVRDTIANGKEIRSGDVIALVDDEITQVGGELDAVVGAALAEAPHPPELITVYRGAGVDAEDASALASSIGGRHPGVEVEVHDGGQEHYPFILSLE